MIKDSSRLKLLHAITFFAQNTKHCGKTKLFKLVYFLDFEHYSEVGRNVTNLDYYAWPMGPVPVSLNDEIESDAPSLTSNIQIIKKDIGRGNPMVTFSPKIEFDEKLFTKRELRIMKSLVDRYSDKVADDLIEATHLENQPWFQVFERENNRQKIIPYHLALKGSEFEQTNAIAKEHREFTHNYQ